MIDDGLHVAFEDLLCQYGADLRTWPKDRLTPVLAFLRSSHAARQRLRLMRRMETMLETDMDGIEPPAGLEDRILSGMLRLREREADPTGPPDPDGALAGRMGGHTAVRSRI